MEWAACSSGGLQYCVASFFCVIAYPIVLFHKPPDIRGVLIAQSHVNCRTNYRIKGSDHGGIYSNDTG